MFNYDKLNNAIEESGKTKAYLCRKLGRPPYFLRDVMRIKSPLSETDQATLATELGVSVQWLNDEPEIKKEQPAANDELSEDEKQFLIWYRTQATERDKAIVRAIVEGE